MFHNHYPDKGAYDNVLKYARAAKELEDYKYVEEQMETLRKTYGTTVLYCRAQEAIFNIMKSK